MKRFSSLFLIFTFMATISMALGVKKVLAQPTEDYVVDVIEPQTYNFEATWTAYAEADSVDGVIGFSEVMPTGYGDFDLKVLFANTGYITVSGDDGFDADSMVAYVAGQNFAFKILADIGEQTYSVWVTPEGAGEILLAEEYAFRPREDKTIDSINYRCVKMGFGFPWGGNEGMVVITDFMAKTMPTESFVVVEIEPQTHNFEATWNAYAEADSVDGVIGFSQVMPTGYGDFDLKVLFANTGYITVSGDDGFDADSMVAYVADQNFAFKMLADVDAQTYSVWVTPEGAGEILLAEDYAFKARDEAVGSINYRCVKMGFDEKWGGNVGMVEITDFMTNSLPTEGYVVDVMESQTYSFEATWNAYAEADSVDGVIGFSEVMPTGYGDFDLKVLFANTGYITVSGDDGFEADSMVAYVADQNFAFKMLADIDAQTYSVWVTPEGAGEILLAEDYAFKARDEAVDSINYRCVKMGFDEKWGGNVGMVVITDFMTMTMPTEAYVVDVIEPQTNLFEATWNVFAEADSVDGVIGFSEVMPTGYGDFDLKVLFANDGYIKVSGDAGFAADSMLAYVADQNFAFKMLANINAQTYSVWVTPEGAGEILLAEDYAFKARDEAVDSINYRCVKMGFDEKWGGNVGMVVITDFMTNSLPTEDFVIVEIEPQTLSFEATWNAFAEADSVDGVIGFSEVMPTGYGDFDLKIIFANDGYIKVSNGASFEADSMLAYVADQNFAFKMLADIDAQTYSVWVTPEGAGEILLADTYAFKVRDVSVDSINYRCIKMGFDEKWGGNVGMVVITDFEVKSVEPNAVNEISIPEYSMSFYPNPMSVSATVQIHTQNPGDHIDLTVYNMMGQKVVNLFSGHQISEIQSFTWNGSNSSGQHVVPGIYLLQLRSNTYRETIRIEVLK